MKVTIYEHAADLPQMPAENFFHSPQLMGIYERTPRIRPYMAVVTGDEGHVEAHLLALLRVRGAWFPPYVYTHLYIVGEGEGRPECFGLMLDALTERFQNKVLYMEVSHLSQKMLGYRQLRKAGYFPVRWMNIHNSLHSRTPEERITPRQLKRIENAQRRGVETKRVETEREFQAFMLLLRHHHWLKPRRYIPHETLFRELRKAGQCDIFITKYHTKVIGCTVCVYSGGDAYLWFSASRRKSFVALHPSAVTFWHTIKHAHATGRQHIRFMDVGLPFRRNPYRDFILRFGGKEVSGYRWFRISIRWVNRLASWLWRE